MARSEEEIRRDLKTNERDRGAQDSQAKQLDAEKERLLSELREARAKAWLVVVSLRDVEFQIIPLEVGENAAASRALYRKVDLQSGKKVQIWIYEHDHMIEFGLGKIGVYGSLIYFLKTKKNRSGGELQASGARTSQGSRLEKKTNSGLVLARPLCRATLTPVQLGLLRFK